MDERTQLGWLARRFGFGLLPGQLDQWEQIGVDGVVDMLVDGDAHGVPVVADPYADLDRRPENAGEGIRGAAFAWLQSVMSTPRPFEAWAGFFWQDYFAVSASIVRRAGFVHDHLRLIDRHALGDFHEFLTEMTTDAAMLIFLDGSSSTGDNPNENYGRELLELYSVGVGNFTEDDVRAAAVALTGWVVRPRFDSVQFVPRRHDSTTQTLLGTSGVHDVDSVIDVVTAHPATAQRVARKAAAAVLGADADEGVIARHSSAFAEDLELRPLFRGLLEDALDGAAQPVIIEPIPWFIAAAKATGATPRGRAFGRAFEATGQVPLNPPNVGGFPAPSSYLSTSATISRFNIGSVIAGSTPEDSPLRRAADAGDLEELADAFGLTRFSDSTAAALRDLDGDVDVLAAALASPDLIVA